ETREGAGKVGSSPPPWPACNKESRRQSPQVRPKHPDLPCAMVLTVSFVLSQGPAFLPLCRDNALRALRWAPAPGRQDHTTSPSVQARVRLTRPSRPSQARLHVS